MSTSCQHDVIASSYWLFCFTVLFSLAEKKMGFRAKNRANQIARITGDLKMDLIKCNCFPYESAGLRNKKYYDHVKSIKKYVPIAQKFNIYQLNIMV